MVQLEAQPSLQQPHTLFFFIATLLCLTVTLLPGVLLRRDRSWERRVYWGGTSATCVCSFFASLPDWKLGIGFALFAGGMLTASAYMYSPYIKVRNKVHAFDVDDALPDQSVDYWRGTGDDEHPYDPAPDAYGGTGITTAKKTWWLMIPIIAMCVLGIVIHAEDKPWWMGPGFGIFFVVLAVTLGHGDASWGYHIARRQRMQFVIITIITGGVFTFLYLISYYTGKRWPHRSKKSMEYRIHPRHWENYR